MSHDSQKREYLVFHQRNTSLDGVAIGYLFCVCAVAIELKFERAFAISEQVNQFLNGSLVVNELYSLKLLVQKDGRANVLCEDGIVFKRKLVMHFLYKWFIISKISYEIFVGYQNHTLQSSYVAIPKLYFLIIQPVYFMF